MKGVYRCDKAFVVMIYMHAITRALSGDVHVNDEHALMKGVYRRD